MPKDNEIYKKYYYDNGSLRMEAKDFESNFVTYLNKFDSLEATVNGEEMSKGEKNCWSALKEYQKENGGEESAQTVDESSVQFEYFVKHPDYVHMIMGVAKKGVEDCGYPAFMFSPYDKNNMAWINTLKDEEKTVTVIMEKAQEKIDEKEGKSKDEGEQENQQEGEKETEGKEEGKEDKPKQNGIIGFIMKVGDKARESNDKAMGIFHDKGNAVSRRAKKPVFEKQEELGDDEITVEIEEVENENQGVHIDLEVIEQEREAAGLVEKEPEVLTNFRAQGEEEMSLEQGLGEKVRSLNDED